MMNASVAVRLPWVCVVPLAALAGGCISHSVQSAPIEIKPIHITMDINLRVQGKLDEFFDFEQPVAATAKEAP
jgi:hypothetical protein